MAWSVGIGVRHGLEHNAPGEPRQVLMVTGDLPEGPIWHAHLPSEYWVDDPCGAWQVVTGASLHTPVLLAAQCAPVGDALSAVRVDLALRGYSTRYQCLQVGLGPGTQV